MNTTEINNQGFILTVTSEPALSTGQGVPPKRGEYDILFTEPLYALNKHGGYHETSFGGMIRIFVDATFQFSDSPSYEPEPPNRLTLFTHRDKADVNKIIGKMVELATQPGLELIRRGDPHNWHTWILDTTEPWTKELVAKAQQLENVREAEACDPHQRVLWVHLNGQTEGESMFDTLLRIVQIQQQ